MLTLAVAAHAATIRVLFIGNSLTAANDLPRLVETIAAANGDRIETTTVAYPNYSLEDHWSHGDARAAIARGGWSFVVFQQGPSALPESQALLLEYARRFAADVRRIHARTAWYMVWPASTRALDFDGVSASYRKAAQEVGGVILPAGDAWRAAWRRRPDLALYGSDGFHPSTLGSLLAALVVYQGLTNKLAARLPGGLVSVTDEELLLSAAAN
jgi:hypothetical protein